MIQWINYKDHKDCKKGNSTFLIGLARLERLVWLASLLEKGLEAREPFFDRANFDPYQRVGATLATCHCRCI